VTAAEDLRVRRRAAARHAPLDVSPDLELPQDVVTQAIALGAVRRAGKALAPATRVLTPTGWATMGEPRAGDMVYDEQGEPCVVTLGALRTAGLIQRGEPIRITPEGLDVIAGTYDPLPAGQALVDHWMHELDKAHRTLLLCLLDVYPRSMTCEQLAEASGYSRSDPALSRPRKAVRAMTGTLSEQDEVTLAVLAMIDQTTVAEQRRQAVRAYCSRARCDKTVAEVVGLILAARRQRGVTDRGNVIRLEAHRG
jgi:stage V sporulation protein SpoVS